MGKQIFALKKSYDVVVNQLLSYGNAVDAPLEYRDRAVEKDFPRTPLLSRKYTVEAFKDALGEGSPYYAQGDFTAGSISESVILLQTSASKENQDNIVQLGGVTWDFLVGSKSHLSFAFFNNHKLPCGLSIAYQKEAPQFFTITLIENTTADPKERQVQVFQSTDNYFYPDLETLAGEAYSLGQLQDQSSLKQSLLSIPDLPWEVRCCILDVISDEGQLNTTRLSDLHEEIKTNNTNLTVTFESEKEIINNLTVYALFCERLADRLAINPLPTDQDLIRTLVQNIRTEIDKANQAMRENSLSDPLKHYDEIKKALFFLFSKADISAPYQTLVKQLNQQSQLADQSFYSRNQGSIIACGAMTTLLAVGLGLGLGATLTSTIVLAPLGIAIMAATIGVIGASWLASAACLAVSEGLFRNYRNNLEQTMESTLAKSKVSGAELESYRQYTESKTDDTKKLSNKAAAFFQKKTALSDKKTENDPVDEQTADDMEQDAPKPG